MGFREPEVQEWNVLQAERFERNVGESGGMSYLDQL
jgi:hypothetical protein